MSTQILWLVILAVPAASITWTVTHEDLFREPHDFCKGRSESAGGLWQRKFFYLFTCEYCFSHYVAAAVLFLTRFKLLYPDWRGYGISFFGLVWISNIYMADSQTYGWISITKEWRSNRRIWTFNQSRSG